MSERDRTSAIVIEAGMAGLLTARALSERVGEVTAIERRLLERSRSRE